MLSSIRRADRRSLLILFAILACGLVLGHGRIAAAQLQWESPDAHWVGQPPEDDGADDADAEAHQSAESEASRTESEESASSEEASAGSEKSPASSPASKPDEDEKDKSNSPQVEVYIPSVTGLVDGFESSRTGTLCDAFAGMFPKLETETDDEFDLSAVIDLFERIAAWPDTSVAMTTYTQDREGRPRWAVCVDWPLDEFADRLREVLEAESAKKVFKDLVLNAREDGSYSLELPDMLLAVLKTHGSGSMLASTEELAPPAKLFGQKAKGAAPSRGGSLIYCRLNMDAGDEDEKAGGLLGNLSMISSLRYAGSVDKEGRWRERFNVRWNPLLGLGIKTLLKKTTKTFESPREAYLTGAAHVAMADGIVDDIAGLPTGTVGSLADSEMSFVIMPGTGFLPIPDVYYQFGTRRVERIMDEIREAMEKETKRRKEDDLPPLWREDEVDGKVIFWKDPSADGGGRFSIATFRTVVFFEETDTDDGVRKRLIVAETSTAPDDAVRRWRELSRGPKSALLTVPNSPRAHWQAVVNWREVYKLAQPYLSLLAASSEGRESAPSVESLGDALVDSVVDVRIEFAGLDVRHTGPIPLGMAYVPGVTIASLSASESPGSEAARERVASRNLRVLRHHAVLFKKDYGRWPATVAELDGYIDFTSHPYLLDLSEKDEGFVAGFVSVFTGDKKQEVREQLDRGEIDDTLYEIDWSEEAWKLKFRENEFLNYATIYIDHEGVIHRVPKPGDEESSGEPAQEKKNGKDKKELARR